MKALLAGWWDERNAREQRLLSLGAIVIGLTLFLRIFVTPAWDGRAAIRAELPGLKRQVATMEGQVNEAKRFAGTAHSATPSGDALTNGVSQSLSDHGLTALKVELNGNAVQIELKKVSFSAWMHWLDEMRKQMKIKAVQVHVTPNGTNGQVDLRATLEAAAPEQRDH
jgi:general secretion pathway protein M